MIPAKVFYSDLRATPDLNLPQKLHKLILSAGIDTIDFKKQFTAIKLHFGEPGNLSFLRPNWAKVVADTVKELGGIPFLTDCNTLYVGRRKNAPDHLDAAMENGFSPLSTGCQIIIADGLKGTDERMVPIHGEYVQEAKIGAAIMDADIFISLNHFKGHEMAGFGGALKNIGMGCGSRAGKMEMHAAGKPEVDQSLCVGCGKCQKNCAHDAITISSRKADIDHAKCVGCGRCIGACPMDAVHAGFDEAVDIMNCKIAEYSKAVLDGRPHFHISLVIDVSPECDCDAYNDYPLVPNVGMFASFDPVALDQACIDAVMAQPPLPGSAAAGSHIHHDHFKMKHPDADWKALIAHAEKIGLGTHQYELVQV